MKFNLHTKGKIIFDPKNETKKHVKQSIWKKTVIAYINNDISQYYAWFIKKRYNINLNIPLRGTHLTIISDKINFEILYMLAKSKYNKKNINIYYNTNIKTDGIHWWINAKCKMAQEIRSCAGLNEYPYFGFHITIGKVYEKDLEHSKYIHKLITTYGKEFSL